MVVQVTQARASSGQNGKLTSATRMGSFSLPVCLTGHTLLARPMLSGEQTILARFARLRDTVILLKKYRILHGMYPLRLVFKWVLAS